MKKKKVRKDTNHTLRRAQHFPVILIAEGIAYRGSRRTDRPVVQNGA